MPRVVGVLDVPEVAAGNPAVGSERFFADPTSATNRLFVRNSAGVLVPAGFGNPMTTAGDLIAGGTAGAPVRLAKGANDTILGVDSTGTLAYRASQAGVTSLLNYNCTADLFNNTAIVANTPTNIDTAKSFTVANAGSTVEIVVRVNALAGIAGGVGAQVRAVVNGVTYKLGGNQNNTNPFGGIGPIKITGLAPGAYTVQLQIVASQAMTLWLRASSLPNEEFLTIQIYELALGGQTGPTGPTGATGATGAPGTPATTNVALRLNYTRPTDLWNATALAAGSYDITADQNFAVGEATSIIQVSVLGGSAISNTGGPPWSHTLVVRIDGTTDYLINSGWGQGTAGVYTNPIVGAPIEITGLSVGNHTVRARLIFNSSGQTAYLRCASTPASEFVHIQVTEIATQGPVGPQGTSFTWRGPWSSVTAYVANDVVNRAGVTYIALSATTNVDPSTDLGVHWAVMVAAGTMTNPMTAPNDLILGGAAGAPARLPVGAANSILGVNGAGAVAYNSAITGSAIVKQLDYNHPTDLFSNTTWATNVGQSFTAGPRNFTVDAATSLITIAVRVGIYSGAAPASSCETQSYLTIDGTTVYRLGSSGSNSTGNPFAGAGPVYISGLTAGNHTVEVFAYSNNTTTGWYCRCASQPTLEYVNVTVIEHKVGVGIKGDSFTFRGAWSSATTYSPNDVVTQGGSAYIAILLTTNHSPGTDGGVHWVVLVASGSLVNPMTTIDDVIIGGTSGVPARLAKGANGSFLGIDGSGHVNYGTPIGFANPMTASQDLIVGGAAGAAGRLAKGTNGTLLGVDFSGNVTYQQGATRLLDFTCATDVLNGNVVNGSFLNFDNRSFTIASANSLIVITVRGSALAISTTTLTAEFVLNVNGVTYKCGGHSSNMATFWFVPAAATFLFTGLPAGTCNLAAYVYASSSTTFYMRCASNPNGEFYAIQVAEIR